MFYTQFGEEPFSIVSKWGMANIVSKGNGLYKVLIQMEQAAKNRASA
jgi:hypothetical protein